MKDIMGIFGFIMGLFFTPYVAIRTWRRGYYEWTWGTILALLVPWVMMVTLFPEAGSLWNNAIGILLFFIPTVVSITAFRKSKEPVAPPAECPEQECGGSGAARGRITLDLETSEKVSTKLTGTLLLVSGLGFFVLTLWFLYTALTWDAPVSMPTNTWGGLAMFFVLGYYSFVGGYKIRNQRPVNIVEKMKYKCGTCKHNWTQ